MLVFKYNLINDFLIIFKTIKDIKFLNKYRIFYNLLVSNKYKKVDYQKLCSYIITEFEKYPDIICGNKYTVYLSKFGAYGSYALPNKIYINIQRENKEIFSTVVHEIVHLQLEEHVIKNGLTHEEKEKLVDNKVLEYLS